jgi:hypothetical protein
MTEYRDPGRIDLRAVDQPVDAERIIQAALARARLGPRALPWLAAQWRPTLAAAAVILLVAMALLWRAPRARTMPVGSLVDWISENHAPTNGEILAAFGGGLR